MGCLWDVYGHLGRFDHDLTATEPWNHWLDTGESSLFYGRTIQVSEILQFTQMTYPLVNYNISTEHRIFFMGKPTMHGHSQ